MESGRATIEGDLLTLTPSGHRLRLRTGVLFVQEVASGNDGYELVGKVKDLEQLAELGGEQVAESVLVGNLAYDVREGLVGDPIDPDNEGSP